MMVAVTDEMKTVTATILYKKKAAATSTYA